MFWLETILREKKCWEIEQFSLKRQSMLETPYRWVWKTPSPSLLLCLPN